MYISTSKNIKNGKIHLTHMIRHSYRENGKVKHKNIGCLNLCPPEELEAIKFALKNKKNISSFIDANNIKLKQGKSFGGVWATNAFAKLLKIDLALGNTEDGKISLMQVLARIIGQGSKLKAVRMQETHALCEILDIKESVNDDRIYRNLDWLSKQQKEIEKKLWKYNSKKQGKHLFLYDVTSTYLEGNDNEYTAYGYNRDAKKGKKQIVIGLLTNEQGSPLKISVFDGNTSDTKTFGDQVKASAEQFGVTEVVFVGDRGMIKSPQIKDLPEGCTYITAMGKKEINTLISNKIIQLSLFDTTLHEVADKASGVRYILRCNPIRKKEIRGNRNDKIRKILKLGNERNEFLAGSKKAKVVTAYKIVQAKINQYNLGSLIKLTELTKESTKLELNLGRQIFKKTRELDGCYVIKSNVSKDVAAEVVHARYKDLKYVEDGFRTMKQSHLELRPVYVRKKERTTAHVFIVMLSYMITREMRLLLAKDGEDILTKEVIESLGLIALHGMSLGNIDKDTQAKAPIYKIPTPSDLNQSYLKRLNINLPEVFIYGMNVATAKSS